MSDLLANAVFHHQSGRLEEAGSIYRRILRSEPGNANALHLYGLLAHQSGDAATAAERIGKAVTLNPRSALYRFNLGLVLAAGGDLEAAAAACRRAIDLRPDFADAHSNLGLVLEKQGLTDAAAACFEEAMRHEPNHVEAIINLGRIRHLQGRPAEARACFEKALRPDPRLAEAHFGIGKLHMVEGDWDRAIESYRQALALKPDLDEAKNNLATAFLALGNYDQAQAAFHDVMKARHGAVRETPKALAGGTGRGGGKPAGEGFIWRDTLADRVEQLEFLLARRLVDPSFGDLAAHCRSLLNLPLAATGPKGAVALPRDQAALIEGLCNSVLSWVNTPPIAGGAVNHGLAFREIEDEYLSLPANAVFFDDFLTPEALAALRRFCHESTIFFGRDPAGYLSSYLRDGFNCDLLYQIAHELRQRLPRVIGDHHLSNMWAYRHKARGKGVVAHTDFGAVTFNFWITPDSANLDADRGGMVVYRKEEPLDWDWMDNNRNKNTPRVKQRIEDFLASAATLTIPYRENRAVLFHSNLFHTSDKIHFKSGFENRRTNVSMLFGNRGAQRV